MVQTDASDRRLGAVLSDQVDGVQTSVSLEAVYPGDQLTQRGKGVLGQWWVVSTSCYSPPGCPFSLWSDHAGGVVGGGVGCQPKLGSGGMLQRRVVASAGRLESGAVLLPQQTSLQWISDYGLYLISLPLWGYNPRHTYTSIGTGQAWKGKLYPSAYSFYRVL